MRLAACLFLCLFLCMPLGLAFGASPGEIVFGEVNPGGYAEVKLLISSVYAEPWIVSFDSDAFDAGNLILPENFSLVAQEPQFVTVVLMVPEDAEARSYSGDLSIRFQSSSDVKGGTRSRVINALRIPFDYEVVGDIRSSCVLGGLSLTAAEPGQEVAVRYQVKNTGTVRTRPVITIANGGDIIDTWAADDLLPTTEQQYTHIFRQDLSPGTYTVAVSSPTCSYERDVEMIVLEPGSSGRAGSLTSLEIDAAVGPQPVRASFQNTGISVVTARLNGVVLDADGHTVAVIESESVRVLPGESVVLEDFVEGLEPGGEYIVRGKVYFEGSTTEEREIVHRVELTSANERSFSWLVFVFLGVIAVLVVLIVEKRSHRKKPARRRKKVTSR